MRKKIKFYKLLLFELVDAISDLCLYVGREPHITPSLRRTMDSHGRVLREAAIVMREDLLPKSEGK